MELRFPVVKEKDELFFQDSSGLLFDILDAYSLFEGGKLTIFRDDEVLTETRSIREYGGHAATTCFIGHHEIFNNYAISNIAAEDLEEGDVVVFESERIPEEFDFVEFLLGHQRTHQTLLDVLRNHPEGVGLETLNREMEQRLEQQPEESQPPTVVRLKNL